MGKLFSMYQKQSSDNLHMPQDIYSSDIQFMDFSQEIPCLRMLTEYLSTFYRNIIGIDSDACDVVERQKSCCLQWDKIFRHKKLAGGPTILFNNTALFGYSNATKVYFHMQYRVFIEDASSAVDDGLTKFQSEPPFSTQCILIMKLLSWPPMPSWTQLAQKMVK